MFYARSGGASAVAPYAADATNKHMWEQEQQRHHRKLAAVARSAPVIDQKAPETHVNNSLLRGRDRSKAYGEFLKQQQTDQANRKLVGALSEISKKQSITLKRAESEPWVLPPLSCASNKAADRRRKQRALAMENEQLVKRLLAIRTTFDRKSDEKNFMRHQRAVQDMRKVPPPSAVAQREKKRVVRLPKLSATAPIDVEAESSLRESVRLVPRDHDEKASSMPALSSEMQKKKKVHIVEADEITPGYQRLSESQGSQRFSTRGDAVGWSPNTSATNFRIRDQVPDAPLSGCEAASQSDPDSPDGLMSVDHQEVDVVQSTEDQHGAKILQEDVADEMRYGEMVGSPDVMRRSESSVKSWPGTFEVHSPWSTLSQHSVVTEVTEEVAAEVLLKMKTQLSPEGKNLESSFSQSFGD